MIATSPPSSGSTKPLNNHNKPKFQTTIITTVAFIAVAVALLSVVLFFTVSSKTTHQPHTQSQQSLPSSSSSSNPPPATYKVPEKEIREACKATKHPRKCHSSLTKSKLVPPHPTPLQVIHSAITLSSHKLITAQKLLTSLLNSANGNINVTNVATICLDVLRYAQYRTISANESLARGKIKNARAWLTAAHTYQDDCAGGLRYNAVKNSGEATEFLNRTSAVTSTALSMLASYDVFGNDTASWRPPRTERDGFWEPSRGFRGGGIRFKGRFPSKSAADATVCVDGRRDRGCYKTVQDAVNAAPNNTVGRRRFVIHIKEGVYEEIVRIPLEKKNVVFLGDGMGKTVITGSLSVGQLGVTTFESATVGVLGDGFMARGLTIQNTAGPPTKQAVAFRSDSDLSVVENCEFLGHQDTLYAHSLRQFYKSCHIEGNVDFIFGNSAAVFQNCTILVRPRQENPEKGENNAVTAHGRTDPAQSTGFVFRNCLINGTEEYMRLYHSKPSAHRNYLGRPWKEYSRTVFIHCNLEALISAEGWMPWSGDFALKTLYYGEFKNSGPGSNLSHRVAWSNQIPSLHTYAYSVQNFIQGDDWIPTSS